jgi:hypothetical protein
MQINKSRKRGRRKIGKKYRKVKLKKLRKKIRSMLSKFR